MMKYQVRYQGWMSNKPMSGLYEDASEAHKKLDEVRDEMMKTWATPDPEHLYVASIWRVR